MSTETSKKAPVSAEPIAYKVPSGTAFAMGISRYQDASCFGGNKAELHAAAKKHEWKPLYTAPVAAQAQPTRRELDMAMLIKNLARQVRRAEPYGTNYHRISDDALDALKRWGLDCSPVRTTKPEGTQSQQVDKSTEMQRQLVHRTPDLHCQQQPVSGDDWLAGCPTRGMTLSQRIAYVGGRENAQGYVEFGSPMAVHALIQHVLHDFHRQGRVNLAPAQQDADKVDAERYQAWRDALITGKTAEDDFIRLVADSLPTSVGVSRRPTAAEWDAAIDAARKEQA
ncbi:MAG: hypothetical protein WDA33_05715 [Alcaligenes sp.]